MVKPETYINPKALQLTIIMLRQYRPQVASLLPGPESYPTESHDVALHLEQLSISTIIASLNELADEWIEQAKIEPAEASRNKLRQKCITFILDEWISVGEQSQRQDKVYSH